MASLQAGEVLLVPPEKRLALLRQSDDVYVQNEDADQWQRPSADEEKMLTDYLQNNYPKAPKRFWMVRTGTRLGFNDEGVFVHENHSRRYFGLEQAKASSVLMHGVTEAVPRVNAKGEQVVQGTKTDQMLSKCLTHLPTLSDDMRYRVLKASFVRADRNGNGKLSRPELGLVFRRVLNTMNGKDVEVVVKEADEDGDGQINYKEFIDWLQSANDHHASAKVMKSFGSCLRNEADIVRATFRLWDKNGDGLIPDAHLAKALEKVHPDLSKTQVVALVKTMDCDHDGNVDYDEFVDFLFHRK